MGEDCIEKIRKSRIVICGLGGVGGFVLEALARLGVGSFFLVDDDRFEITNLNRQILSNFNNIGKLKVEEAIDRLKLISDCDVLVSKNKVQDAILEIEKFEPNVIIDAIDDLEAKILLIGHFYKKSNIVVSAGAGNRIDPTMVTYADLSKTSNCSIARILRKRLKSFGIVSGIDVVFSKETPKKEFNNSNIVSSAVFVPMAFGALISYLTYRLICNSID
ncbi:UBA/THIF-type NAD/FAD binding protein [Thermodesulfobium narugense DSM 14796]|uniref:UBA/THIF-type NAD/FAD binding protein n=1 Tax=Thermodesulfobium narugense DSM 14796 TaxID=747365 RepID=M1E6I0_9BACT|nr:UBA/THIF-type NAD/FAD binding protein [Thermodesulfobium narugense DSM 14796]